METKAYCVSVIWKWAENPQIWYVPEAIDEADAIRQIKEQSNMSPEWKYKAWIPIQGPFMLADGKE